MAVIGEEELLSLPFRWVVLVVGGVPVLGLCGCISLAMALHLDDATRTACGANNWLPALAAAVGAFAPERYLWRMLIALHAAPRYALAVVFRNLLLTSPLRPLSAQTWFPWVCHLACGLGLVEGTLLLLLSAVSPTENALVHNLSFAGFAVFSMGYMVLATWLFHYSARRRTSSLGERSFQYKVLMCSASSVSLFLMVYLLYRHSAFCEPGVYTVFAASEYAFLLSNALFHSTLLLDFHGRRFVLVSSGSSYHYQSLLPLHDGKKRSS